MSRPIVYPGVNGKQVAVDLDAVQVVEEHDGETHLWMHSEFVRVAERFDVVVADWKASGEGA